MSEMRNPAIVDAAQDERAWWALLERRDNSAVPVTGSPVSELYGPLCRAHGQARVKGSFAVAHLAQSLDGRIATRSGISQWVSGEEDLLHTHRMRALADAVLVGVETVLLDDPQLTVRRCAGENPVRAVIDPERRLDGSQRIFREGAAPTLVFAAADRARSGEALGNAEVVPLSRGALGLDPHEIRRVLAHRGYTWLFIEGGGVTVSRFLEAKALDCLQITVAPLLIGSGRPSIALPEIENLDRGLRPRTRRFVLGNDVMIECNFDG
jgi:riboflavin-specific deaminase-like protein